MNISRLLLALSAAILAAGGMVHAAAFKGTSAALAASDINLILANKLRMLWLADSTTLLSVAIIAGFVAARPGVAGRPVILLLALIPAATAALLYAFCSQSLVMVAHLLLVVSLSLVVAGILIGRASGE